jgi:putative phosphonate metabolism protein
VTTARYAIYVAPRAETRLWSFGKLVLGYDAETGQDVAQPTLDGLSADDVFDRTADPRKYGFHATLKPPFHLIDGETLPNLLEAAEAFAASTAPFTVPPLEIAALGAFLALVPKPASPELHALADSCVRTFEPFRAPISPEDRARRLKSPLSDRQVGYLDLWGYPYVFDEFRFHMTLTGRLHHDERDLFRAALTDLYSAYAEPLEVRDIAIYEQATRADRFTVKARIPLTGTVSVLEQDAFKWSRLRRSLES